MVVVVVVGVAEDGEDGGKIPAAQRKSDGFHLGERKGEKGRERERRGEKGREKGERKGERKGEKGRGAVAC